METLNPAQLETLRFPTPQAFGDALTACGGKREGRSSVYAFDSGLRVRVYKRGSASFAACVVSEASPDSLLGSVLADYASGNVREIRVP